MASDLWKAALALALARLPTAFLHARERAADRTERRRQARQMERYRSEMLGLQREAQEFREVQGERRQEFSEAQASLEEDYRRQVMELQRQQMERAKQVEAHRQLMTEQLRDIQRDQLEAETHRAEVPYEQLAKKKENLKASMVSAGIPENNVDFLVELAMTDTRGSAMLMEMLSPQMLGGPEVAEEGPGFWEKVFGGTGRERMEGSTGGMWESPASQAIMARIGGLSPARRQSIRNRMQELIAEGDISGLEALDVQVDQLVRTIEESGLRGSTPWSPSRLVPQGAKTVEEAISPLFQESGRTMPGWGDVFPDSQSLGRGGLPLPQQSKPPGWGDESLEDLYHRRLLEQIERGERSLHVEAPEGRGNR